MKYFIWTLLTFKAKYLSEPCSQSQQRVQYFSRPCWNRTKYSFLNPAHIHRQEIIYLNPAHIQSDPAHIQSKVLFLALFKLNRVLFNPAHIHSKVFIWILLTLTAIHIFEPCPYSQKVISCSMLTFWANYIYNNSNFPEPALISRKGVFWTMLTFTAKYFSEPWYPRFITYCYNQYICLHYNERILQRLL